MSRASDEERKKGLSLESFKVKRDKPSAEKGCRSLLGRSVLVKPKPITMTI